jgi:hypothetical protein
MKNCATCSNGKLVMLSVGCPRSVHLPSTIVMHSKYAMNPFYVSHALTQTKCGPRFHVRSLARNNHTHTRSVYAYPELFFGALPAPLLFFSGAPPGPTGSLLGSLISLFPGLTFKLFCFPPASRSASASSASGDVFEGSKAVSECAAPSSEPDFAYSVDRGFSESLSCASFCANRAGLVERKRERAT